jgi:hypothetical protein
MEKTCSKCGRKLNFWNKARGRNVCNKCVWDETKVKLNDIQKNKEEMQKKTRSIAKKMFMAGIALLFLLIGVFTLPFGIIFWIFSIILFVKVFSK